MYYLLFLPYYLCENAPVKNLFPCNPLSPQVFILCIHTNQNGLWSCKIFPIMLNVILISTNIGGVKHNSMAKAKCLSHTFSFNFIELYSSSTKPGSYEAQQR